MDEIVPDSYQSNLKLLQLKLNMKIWLSKKWAGQSLIKTTFKLTKCEVKCYELQAPIICWSTSYTHICMYVLSNFWTKLPSWGTKSAAKCPYKLQAAVRTHGCCFVLCCDVVFCCFVVCKILELKINQQPENLIKVFFLLCFRCCFGGGKREETKRNAEVQEEKKRTNQTNNKTQSLTHSCVCVRLQLCVWAYWCLVKPATQNGARSPAAALCSFPMQFASHFAPCNENVF